MKSLFTATVFIIFCLQLHAQPGTLDYSFGDNGKVISTTYQGQLNTSLLQPDGKIVLGGGFGYYFKDGLPVSGTLLSRYNKDGSIDLSFGDSGRAVYNFGDLNFKIVNALALQKDGKIVALVHGFFNANNLIDLVVIRLNADGSVDESFGTGGKATLTNYFGGSYGGKDMALLPDGRIIVTGNVIFDVNDNYPFIACFKQDGLLDNSFGEEGQVVITEPKQTVIVSSIAITKEGRIMLGGNYNVATYKTLLFRYYSDGIPDKSFGKNGIAEMSFKKAPPQVRDIAITEDNTIVAVGSASLNSPSYYSFMVSRFLENGMPDSSFGTNGFTINDFTNRNSYFNSVALQSNGKIVTCGIGAIDNISGFTTLRYDRDGFLDSTFGDNGIVRTSFTGDSIPVTGHAAMSVLVQPEGKIITSGFVTTKDYSSYTAIARYYGDDKSKKQIIVTKIKRWLQHHGISWQTDNNVRYYNVQRSNDGGITYQPVAKIYNNRQPQYSYEEASVKDNSLYRVAVVGKDGSRTYSNSILINNEASVSVFPNPVRNNLQVQGLAAAGKTNISITDFSGTVRTSAVASGSTYSINTANLKPGNYLLKVQHDNTVTTQTFVKE